MIPDGRISRVRFWPWPVPAESSQRPRNCVLAHLRPTAPWFTLPLVRPAHRDAPRRSVRLSPPGANRHVPRAPLRGAGATRTAATSRVAWRGVTLSSSLIRAHAPDHIPPTAFSLGLGPWVCAGCCQPRLRCGPSRRYLCGSVPRCLDPCRGGSKRCTCPLLPSSDVGLPLVWIGSAARK
jgi:hypothetical protein